MFHPLSCPNLTMLKNISSQTVYQLELNTTISKKEKTKLYNTPDNLDFTFISKCADLMSKRLQAAKQAKNNNAEN